ncbi:hypothetical protein Sjap_005945 [Stephania japonica]|uniref:Uncharacterized protein n=1 Tax=Stephania japonica TaxID=461633 RepID=A0AAP0K7G2_9MAGN|nr:COMT protein [Stephania japonica]
MEIMNSKDNLQSMEAQAHVWNTLYRFSDSLFLRSMVELGIPDLIYSHKKPISLRELASKLPLQDVNLDKLCRVLRHLAYMKIVRVVEDVEHPSIADHYKYTLEEPIGHYLLKSYEKSMVSNILGMLQKEFVLPWHYIKEGLNVSSIPFEKAMGMTFWEYLEGHLDDSNHFNEGMASETRLLTSSLIDGCRDIFQSTSSLVDVGGGNGTTLKAISKAFPHIKCTLFDLPYVVANAHDSPGIDILSGDMFKSIPSAQAILLKLILHDWGDEDSVKILKKCKEAVAREGGKVIVVDVALEDEGSHVDALSGSRLALDMDMLVTTGGKERTKEDWEKLVKLAGFKGCKIRHIGAIQSVIELIP